MNVIVQVEIEQKWPFTLVIHDYMCRFYDVAGQVQDEIASHELIKLKFIAD